MRTERQLLRAPERQEAILRGAAVAFARTGFRATSMEDIAAASGITKLIVYRHFDSKEDLYRRVLERVAVRMRDLFVEGVDRERDAGPSVPGVHAFLAAAREDPDGFRLLWQHAAREPAFAPYAAQLRDRAVGATRLLLDALLTDPSVAAWGADTIVGFLVESTLNWLTHGDPARDAAFERIMSESLRAMVGAWVQQQDGGVER